MGSKCWLCKEVCEKYSIYSFHRFPRDEKLKLLWLKSINRQNCTPPKKANLCSQHFVLKDFNPRFVGKIRKLNPDAMPVPLTSAEEQQLQQTKLQQQQRQELLFEKLMPVLKRFPVNLERRKQWVHAINRVGFIPGKHSSLCSKHFTDKDYNINATNKRVLKKDAIPSIFNTSLTNSDVLSVSRLRETLYKKMTAFAHKTVDESSISTSDNLSYENGQKRFKRTASSSPVSELLTKRHNSDLSSTVNHEATTEIYSNPAVVKREERIARRNSKKLVSELLKQASGPVTQTSNKIRKQSIQQSGAVAKINKTHICNNTNQHTQNKQVLPTQKNIQRRFIKKPIAVKCTCCQTPASSNNVNLNSQIKTELESGKQETQFEKKDTKLMKQTLLFENIDNQRQCIQNIIKKEIKEENEDNVNIEQVYVIGAPEPIENIKEEIKTEIDIKEEPLFP